MKRLLRGAAVVLCLTLGVSVVPAQAQWVDHSDELPGMVSNTVIITLAVAGGALIGYMLFAKHRNGVNLRKMALQAPERINFGAAETEKTVTVSNTGRQPLNLSEVGLFGKGFSSAVSTPVVIPPGGYLDLVVVRDPATAGRKARLRITAVTADGKSLNREIEIQAAESEDPVPIALARCPSEPAAPTTLLGMALRVLPCRLPDGTSRPDVLAKPHSSSSLDQAAPPLFLGVAADCAGSGICGPNEAVR